MQEAIQILYLAFLRNIHKVLQVKGTEPWSSIP